MTGQSAKTNQVFLTGKIVSDFQFSHRLRGKYFYKSELIVKRNSGTLDHIPLIVSGEAPELLNLPSGMGGAYVYVAGEFRSYMRHVSGKNRLLLSVFAEMLQAFRQRDGNGERNQIYLDGYICKQPVYRITPMGRKITDIIVAVNRPYHRADYIPCICWGRYALAAAELGIGSHIQLQGRIQSREYIKRYHDGRNILRTAYEVSVSQIICLDVES